MDDWNRVEERWEMQCPICKEKYELFEDLKCDRKGTPSRELVWVVKESLEDINNERSLLQREINAIEEYARAKYIEAWVSSFSVIRSKKDFWKIITSNGTRYPSLSTYYKNTKGKCLEDCIRREFKFNNLAKISERLNLKDITLESRLAKVKQIKSKIISEERELFEKGYR